MKTSTEINSIAGAVGMEKAVELVARAGFDFWDFSMFAMGSYDWSTGKRRITGHPLETRDSALKLAEKLRKIGLENGIYCNQSHAPFPVSCGVVMYRTAASERIRRPAALPPFISMPAKAA